MRKSKLLIAFAVLVFVAGATAQYFHPRPTPHVTVPLGCDKWQQIDIDFVPPESMGAKTKLYEISNSGKLFTLDLATGRTTTISDHDFNSYEPEYDYHEVVSRSADGRWFSYAHQVGDTKVQQYWIYDTQAGRDRLAFETKAWYAGSATLSPDGSLLAVAPNFGTWKLDPVFETIHLVDTATLKDRRVNLPTTRPIQEGNTSIRWSADGRQLLVKFSYTTDDISHVEYFSWNVADQRADAITGEDSDRLRERRFIRDGKEIPLAPIMEEQSASYNEELASPAGTWHAKLQKLNHAGKLALEVRGNDGTIKTAFSAPYLPCAKDALPMPVELSILGWLDDNHLVYRDDSIAYYVFDASTGKTAFLFSASEDTHQFLW